MNEFAKNKFVNSDCFSRVIQDPVTWDWQVLSATNRCFNAKKLKIISSFLDVVNPFDNIFLPAEDILTKEETCTRKWQTMIFSLISVSHYLRVLLVGTRQMKIIVVIIVIMNAVKDKYICNKTRPEKQNQITLLGPFVLIMVRSVVS